MDPDRPATELHACGIAVPSYAPERGAAKDAELAAEMAALLREGNVLCRQVAVGAHQ